MNSPKGEKISNDKPKLQFYEKLVQVKRSRGSTITYTVNYSSCTGASLLAECCTLRGLREYNYFGLRYLAEDGQYYYLDENKLISDSPIKMPEANDQPIELQLRPMFYPEQIDELIEPKTIKMFYDQTQQDLIDGTLQCPDQEMKDLLNSLTGQIGEAINPTKGMMDYLQVASLLQMFGIEYFKITNQDSNWLGIYSKGINIYKDDQLTPISSYEWSDISKIKVWGSKLVVKTKKGDKLVFETASKMSAKQMMRLCDGNRQEQLERGQEDKFKDQLKLQTNRELQETEYWFALYQKEKEKFDQLMTKVREIQLSNVLMFILYETVLTADRVAAADLTMFYWLIRNEGEWPSIEYSLQKAIGTDQGDWKIVENPTNNENFLCFPGDKKCIEGSRNK